MDRGLRFSTVFDGLKIDAFIDDQEAMRSLSIVQKGANLLIHQRQQQRLAKEDVQHLILDEISSVKVQSCSRWQFHEQSKLISARQDLKSARGSDGLFP